MPVSGHQQEDNEATLKERATADGVAAAPEGACERRRASAGRGG